MPQTNVRNRLPKQEKSRRGSSVALNPLRKKHKTGAGKRRPWRPDVLKRFPWLGLLALLGVVIRQFCLSAYASPPIPTICTLTVLAVRSDGHGRWGARLQR